MSPQPEPIQASPGQLEDVWLHAVDFEEVPGFTFDAGDVTYSVQIEDIGVEEREDDGTILTIVVSLDWMLEGEEISPDLIPPMDLTLSVRGRFSWADEGRPTEEKVGWTSLNGIYLLWPYLRSYVAMITGASSLPKVVVPTMVVPGGAIAVADETSQSDHLMG